MTAEKEEREPGSVVAWKFGGMRQSTACRPMIEQRNRREVCNLTGREQKIELWKELASETENEILYKHEIEGKGKGKKKAYNRRGETPKGKKTKR